MASDAKVERMARACRELIECLGEDADREGLRKTPVRMAKALLAITAGYSLSPKAIVADALFECSSKEMVLVRDIEINSMCEHHMLPFFGRAHIAYLPEGRVVGLSKLARLADCFAKRLQIQERLTTQLADAVAECVAARGVAVVVECSHMCMSMRGVSKPGASTVTSAFTGAFAGDAGAALRSEFYAVLGCSGLSSSAASVAADAVDAGAATAGGAHSGTSVDHSGSGSSSSGSAAALAAATAAARGPGAFGGFGHGAYGLGSPRFAPASGPRLVRGLLPAAACTHGEDSSSDDER